MEKKTVKLKIEKLSGTGSGVGHIDDKVVFVEGALPGEMVEVEVVQTGKYIDAHLINVLEKSGSRVEPPCEYFGKCGGCQLQNLKYDSQVEFKKNFVLYQLERRLGDVFKSQNYSLNVHPAKKIYKYRNKIQVHLANGKLGFNQKKSNKIIEIEKCKIASELVNEKLLEFKTELKSNSTLSTLPNSRVEIMEAPSISSGEKHVLVQIDNRVEFGFSQVNTAQNEKLISIILELAKKYKDTKKDLIVGLDLYAGAGNFTFPLAEEPNCFSKIFAVEKNKQSKKEFSKQSKVRPVESKTEFILSDVSEGLDLFKEKKASVDFVVLDPPRDGIGEAIEKLIDIAPERIVMVACDPISLARDYSFISSFYKISSIDILDMFPQTTHVETIMYLEKI